MLLALFPLLLKALIFTDGVGEWATTSVAIGKSNDIQIKKEINFPHSLVSCIQHLHITVDLK